MQGFNQLVTDFSHIQMTLLTVRVHLQEEAGKDNTRLITGVNEAIAANHRMLATLTDEDE